MFNQLLLFSQINFALNKEELNSFYKFLFDWQSLIGACIGAATPLFFWFFVQWFKSSKKYKENLYYLTRLLVYKINMVNQAQRTIKHFTGGRLTKLISNIDEASKKNKYCLDTVFFPLFTTDSGEQNLLKIHTKSGYLDNLLAQIFNMSNDFTLSIDDIRAQYQYTLEINKEMAINKKNPAQFQNGVYKKNIQDFIEFINKDFIGKNLKVYIHTLASALIITTEIYNIGIIRWRMKFSPSFRFFKNKQEYDKFKIDTHERIEKNFKAKIDQKIKEIEKLQQN